MIYQNGNLDLATFDQDGNSVKYKNIKFPWDLEFVPNRDILKPTNFRARFYKQLVKKSKDINVDDILFTVRGRSIDRMTGQLSEFEEIGHILQGDAIWTESLWGDERLFFSHNMVLHDVRDTKLKLRRNYRQNLRRERI